MLVLLICLGFESVWCLDFLIFRFFKSFSEFCNEFEIDRLL